MINAIIGSISLIEGEIPELAFLLPELPLHHFIVLRHVLHHHNG